MICFSRSCPDVLAAARRTEVGINSRVIDTPEDSGRAPAEWKGMRYERHYEQKSEYCGTDRAHVVIVPFSERKTAGRKQKM